MIIRTSAECDGIGNNRPDLGQKCGRPLGLGFFERAKELYVADAYRGFLVVGFKGLPFKLPLAVDVDQFSGNVYFTDTSSNFSLSQIQTAIDEGDASGRLLSYNRRTQQVTVLQSGLSGAGGVALSKDRSYILVSEIFMNQVRKFWLRGPKASTSEILVTFSGLPINIKRTIQGQFWVAVNERTQSESSSIERNVREGVKINGNGNILKTLDLSPYYGVTNISEFQQRGNKFYIGTLRVGWLGVLAYNF